MMIPGTRLQSGGCFVGDDAAVRDDDGARADLVHLFQNVRRDDDQLVFAELIDQTPNLVLLIRIESVGGFVENQHLRIVNQRLRQADAAPETLRQGLDDLVDHRAQAQPVDDDVAALAPQLTAQPAHVGDEVQKFADGHLTVARRPFRQIAHASLRRDRSALDVVPADRHLTLGGRNEAGDHPHGRGLAGAVGAQEAEHLSRRDAEVQIVDRQLVAIAFG